MVALPYRGLHQPCINTLENTYATSVLVAWEWRIKWLFVWMLSRHGPPQFCLEHKTSALTVQMDNRCMDNAVRPN
jgi:hypothetical protein